MASLDSLPGDQRAVLQLVLQRGRSYDEIARMLSIDRAAVRERALSAFDALGPQTRVPAPRRALITDYLLGQLPERASEETRARLSESSAERAWARVLASELAPLAKDALPEIPVEASRRAADPAREASGPAPAAAVPSRAAGLPAPAPEPEGQAGRGAREHPSSRRGGALLLGLGALAVVIVVLIIVISGGGSSKPKSTTSAASTPTTATPTTPGAVSTPTTGTGTSTTATGAKLVAQVNLVSPTGAKKTVGVAQVIKQGANMGLVIVAQGVAANTNHNAYAVWLYNSTADNHLLGFVNPGVKADGKLQTAGVLPANASHYRQLLLTLETQAKPHAPGTIVLQGALSLH